MLGKGFILSPDQARELIDRDPRNKEVLFPYLNGEDLNSRPDCSASRWVINFHDWSEERARSYPEVFDIVERLVKPERAKNNNRQRREIWWRFTRSARDLYKAISGLDRALVVSLVGKVVMPNIVNTGQVFSHKLGVFASDDLALLALLSSTPHYWWAIARSSTLETRTNYSPTDAYETFPFPSLRDELRMLGMQLYSERRALMRDRSLGLTKLYNLVHDPSADDEEILRVRELHQQIDLAVAEAYGWADLDFCHAFRETRQGMRYTASPATQVEVLDRLLELNRERGLTAGQSTATDRQTKLDLVFNRQDVSILDGGEGVLF